LPGLLAERKDHERVRYLGPSCCRVGDWVRALRDWSSPVTCFVSRIGSSGNKKTGVQSLRHSLPAYATAPRPVRQLRSAQARRRRRCPPVRRSCVPR
jgi:hypothetical protein